MKLRRLSAVLLSLGLALALGAGAAALWPVPTLAQVQDPGTTPSSPEPSPTPAPPPSTAPSKSPGPSPSDPPFWARPRPAQPVAGPDCNCEEPAPVRQTRGTWTPAALGLAVGAVSVLLLVWIRSRTAPAPTIRQHARPTIGGPPPAPPDDSHQLPEPLPVAEQAQHIEVPDPEQGTVTPESLKFYSDVAASLSDAVSKHPERQDLWMKLFEVYSTSKMADEYINLTYAFIEQHDGRSSVYWQQIGAMGRELLPEHELFHEVVQTPSDQRSLQFRRFYDRNLDQGAMLRAQDKLENQFNEVRLRPDFQSLLRRALADGAHRPSPVVPVPVIDLAGEGARIFLKREDRRRTNDETMINVIGQVLLAQHLGHRRILTATHDGTHGLATATVAARLGLECVVYISEANLREQYARVLTLRRLGAQVRPVRIDPESRFSDPRQYALTEWLDNVDSAQYICDLTGGPQPYPMIVGELQAMVGLEAAEQVQRLTGRLPGAVVAHARDGYLGMGLLRGFLQEPSVKLYYIDAPDPDTMDSGSGAGRFLREHRWLRDTGRVLYLDGNDSDAMRVIEQFHSAGTSLHSATGRTLAHARQVALQSDPDDVVLVMYSRQDELR